MPGCEPWLTLGEVAKRLGVSERSVWRWRVPGRRLGGCRRFKMSEVEAYLESEAFEARVEELREERRK